MAGCCGLEAFAKVRHFKRSKNVACTIACGILENLWFLDLMKMEFKYQQCAVGALVGALLYADGLSAEPTMTGDTTLPWCQDALLLAQETFRSNTSRVYAPLAIPAEVASEMVLGTLDVDLQSTGRLRLNDQLFTLDNKLYWQQSANHGVRLVLKATALGAWGDRYTLLQLPPDITTA